MTGTALESVLKRDRLAIVASLAALFLLSWIFLVNLAAEMASMRGIAARTMGMRVDDGISEFLAMMLSPTTAGLADAGVTFALVAFMWMVMMVGMMLPSAAPTILLFAALERKAQTHAPAARSGLFTGGYLLVWGGFSIAASALQTALRQAGFLSMDMAATGALLGGGIFILAGLYEFTPLKNHCLTHCRSPMEWLPRHWRPGRLGALRMGAEHGLYCVGCCWMLMLLLFVGGVMNLVWVAAIAAIVLVEKLLPRGPFFARAAGLAFAIWGIVLIARPLIAA